MKQQAFGVDVDDLRLGVKEGLRAAAESNYQTVEIGAATGELSPDGLTPSARRHVRRYVDDLGLSFAALTADLPRLRLTDSAAVDERVNRTRLVLDLSRELGVSVVTTGIGVLTHPTTGEPSPVALSALRSLGEYADSRGVMLALRPAGDTDEHIQRVLYELACPSIKLCLDPAAALMHGANPLAIVERLSSQLILVHARDATVGRSDGPGHETTLGDGDADWPALLRALHDADYARGLILRRTDSQRPQEDLIAGRDYLKRLG